MVLIDTWWNVNVIEASRGFLKEKVLIDTWWNVNFGVWTTAHARKWF